MQQKDIEEKDESGELERMQIMQSLLRQGKALEFYSNCNWKPIRGVESNFKHGLQH